jgi:hypothetical protein
VRVVVVEKKSKKNEEVHKTLNYAQEILKTSNEKGCLILLL